MALKNIVTAAVLLAIGIVYFYLATQLPVRSLPNIPGPSFFPYLIAVVLVGLGLALLVQGLRAYRPAPVELNLAERARAIAALVLFAAYLTALPWLGFLVASVPFAGGMIWLYGGRNPVLVAGGAVALPLLLSLLFREVFRIPLPQGSWAVFGG